LGDSGWRSGAFELEVPEVEVGLQMETRELCTYG